MAMFDPFQTGETEKIPDEKYQTLSGGEVAMALNGTASGNSGLVTCTPIGTGTAISSAGGIVVHREWPKAAGRGASSVFL
jgi:hypothetical protein